MKRTLLICMLLCGAAHGQDAAALYGVLAGVVTALEPAEWTPLSLGSKLAIWYDGADASTMLDNNGNQATPSTAVKTWEDKSGNSFHAVASSDITCPVMTPNAQNGLTALVSTNEAQMSISAAGVFKNKQKGYIFAVLKDGGQSSGRANHGMVMFPQSGTAGSPRIGILGRRSSSALWSGQFRREDGETTVYADGGSISGYVRITAIANWIGGTGSLMTNGVLASAVNLTGGSGTTSDTDSGTANLFRYAAPTSSPAGTGIAELFVVNAEMTSTEINAAHDYLKTKWGTP